MAVQLCTLPWLGFVPDEVGSAPAGGRGPAGGAAGRGSGGAARVRASARRPVRITCGRSARYLGGGSADTEEMKELEEFLLDRAMEHDSPTLLFSLACEYLMSAR